LTPAFALAIALSFATACGDPAAPAHTADPATLRSEPGAYNAMAPDSAPKLSSGAYGVVKLTAEHQFEGEETASYVAQGAGTLLVSRGDWYVVTARHVVVPNPGVREIDGVTLGPLKRLRTRVAISSLGVEPTSLRYSTEHDVALLAIGPEDRARLHRIVNLDPAAPIPLREDEKAVQPGHTVEAWGYPAKHLPQLSKPAITTQQETYFVLNEALQRGYSGGPVLAPSGSGKAIAGIIIRAEDEDDQTLVLNWSLARSLLTGGDATEVALGSETTHGGLPLAFSHTLPAAPSQGD